MRFWKTAALAVAVAGAAGVGAALAPLAHAQSGEARVVTPRMDVFAFGGSRLGVSVSDLDASDVKDRPAAGVRVDEVDEGSPAEKAGIRKGDVVVEFDGERVRSVRQLTRLVNETPAGRTVSAAVLRDGQRVSLTVTPTETSAFRAFDGEARRRFEELTAVRPRVIPSPAPAPLPPSIEFWRGGTQLGVTTTDVSSQLGDYFGVDGGALVTSVREDSPAAKAGVKAGDVITSVNGTEVDGTSDLRRQVQRLERNEEFTLGVVRDKKSLTLKGKIEPAEARRRTVRTIL